jgi:hypothetical protein
MVVAGLINEILAIVNMFSVHCLLLLLGPASLRVAFIREK